MAGSLGTIFVEMDIDRDRWSGAQRRLLTDATSTSLKIEDNFRKLGIKSSAEMDLMRRKITNSFNMIKNSSQATSNDIVRAEKAKNAQLKTLNEQQFSHQTSLLSKLKEHWVGVSVAIYAAMRVIRAGWEILKEAANFEQQQKSFANLTASYGVNGDEIIKQLKKISSNTISTMVLIEKAGTAMMMGIDPDKVIKLMEIARATARMTGQSVSQAFSDISLAVGRQSKMILDNLGIIVSVEAANKAYAQSLGKTSLQLTDVEKKQAFMYATIEAGTGLMERLGEQTDTTRDRMDRLTTVFANLKIQIGLATIAMVGFIEKMTDKSLDVIFGPITGDPKELAKQALQKQLELAMRSYKLMAQQGNIDQETLHLAEARMFTLRQRIAILEESIRIKPKNIPGAAKAPPPGSTAPPPDAAMLRLEEQAEIMMAKSEETLFQKTDMEKFMESGLTDALYDMRQKRLEDQTGFAQKSLELNQWQHDAALLIAQQEADELNQIDRTTAQQRYQTQLSYLNLADAIGNAAISMTTKQGKTQFILQKSFQVGMAVMDAWLASNNALATVPYPANIAAASHVLTVGLIGAAAIAAASIGQIASGGGSAGGGGGTITTPSYPAYTPGYYGEDQQKGTLTINIQGDVIGDEAYIEMLAEKISEAVENRDVILVASNAKYANKVF